MSALHPIAAGLWSVHNDLFLPGGVHFPGRMVVVELASGGLLLHSPVPIDAACQAELAALGPVEHIVAPNKLHHLYVEACQQAFPEATTWAAPGLAQKRPDLRFDATLPASGQSAPPWAADFEPCFIPGIPWMNETAFLHPPSRTLVVTDLFFNLVEVANRRSRWLFTLYGVFGRPTQSPVVWWMTRDVALAGAAAQSLLAWRPERLVPAHGAVVEVDATSVLAAVLQRLIAAASVQVEAR